MNIVLLCHPDFSTSQSMPRFARMLEAGFTTRGHQVTRWAPRARVQRRFMRAALKKWAGYVDQYVIFPREVKQRLKDTPAGTVFVFCDQALGPWVPLVSHLPHVVHAHDLLALRSALGLIPENPTGPTGRVYQRFIRRGFSRAKNFISISKKTRDDLHHYGEVRPVISEVIYNGLNYPYSILGTEAARVMLAEAGLPVSDESMLLHVGNNQWYKNLRGVLEWYAAYAAREPRPLPLWCISPRPSGRALEALAKVPSQGKVLFFRGLSSQALQAAYSYARVFLFPSLAEGFGWPIVEAQACGCPVISTNEAPMTEVGGSAAVYLPRLQAGEDAARWADGAATVLQQVLAFDPKARADLIERGIQSAKRFDAEATIDAYLGVYQRVLDQEAVLAAANVSAGTQRAA